MNLRRKTPMQATVNTASLNDIMFFLLLFFLLASTMAAPHSIKINLPKAAAQQSVPKQHVSISVSKEGTYYVGDKLVSFTQLDKTLQDYAPQVGNITILIRADAAAKVEPFVKAIALSGKYGLKTVVATADEK